jgi:uncharacterized protein YjgD (DUF1641 family)
MDADLALLHEKIDRLAEQVEEQRLHQTAQITANNGDELAHLHQKIDFISQQMELQATRAQALDELKDDMIPIANHLIKLTIDELAEIGTEFQMEDLLFLLKRLLRDTHLLLDMLDRLEAVMGLADELQLLGKGVFNQTVETLEQMEQQGYFEFARGGMYIMERVVDEFGEEDVRALGDNIVTILTTVRNMTQPEILAMANNAVGAMTEVPTDTEPLSTLALLREFNDPKVRIGLTRMLGMVKAIADQPHTESKN